MTERKTQLTIGGFSYIMIAIGTGMAVSSWGGGFFDALVAGFFWPGTLAYWLFQVLHNLAA